jgi:hypothetical protein
VVRPIKRIVALAVLGLVFPAVVEAQVRPHTSVRAPAIAAGNLPGCIDGTLSDPRPLMKSFKATILRVVASPRYGARGQALPCIATANSEGYRVELVIQWTSTWSLSRTKQFFRQILGIYGRSLWAVGVGNEQEITPRLSGAGYAQAWRALEPIVKAVTPHAIRVGGEASPWGFSFLKGALRAGLPGIQALAVHPYRYPWAPNLSKLLALAREYGLPLWADEGLYDGARSWNPSRDLPLSEMGGVAVAGVWAK